MRLAIGLLSGAALAYQLLLMRLFSIVQWHHFAYMVISLALLGYGASGAFVSVLRRPLLERFDTAFVVLASLFGPLAVTCFCLSQQLRFNPLEVMWTPRQLGALAAVYLLLALPFFCAGSAVGLALARFEDSLHRIYRADLVGAAAGAAAGIGVLYVLEPSSALRWVGLAGGLAAALVWATKARGSLGATTYVIAGWLAGAAIVSSALWPASWLEPRMSEYKALPKALAVPGVEVVAERSSPLGALAVVSSERVPFRMAAGLSLGYSGEIPEQRLVFRDGEIAAVLDRGGARNSRNDEPAAYLGYLPLALPFELHELTTASGGIRASGAGGDRDDGGDRGRVAVLGAGAGPGLALARAYDVAEIHAVEIDPRLLELLTVELADFAGRPYDDPRVRRHVLDPRGFLTTASGPFDLILLPAVGIGSGAGTAPSLSESYVHTVGAFALALERSSENGIVAVEGEITAPLRTSLKLVASATTALERSGLDPRRHLAVIRSWNRFVIVLKRSIFEDRDIDTLRGFCAERSFDLGYYPGMSEFEANRFNLLERPELFRGITALLGPSRSAFVRDYKFDVRPVTDDRPYVLHFFRWGTLAELLGLRRSGGAALLEWPYVLLVVTLCQAAIAGLVLILLPLWWLRRRGHEPLSGAPGAGTIGLYFLCLGIAFLFLEIAFIQRMTLFLAHPLLAAAVVLAGFLLFAGLGSGASQRYEGWLPRAPIRSVAAAIVVLTLAELVLLPALFTLGSAWPLGLRLAAALLAIAPLAFLLGMPFPLGLRRVAATHRDLVPWAWGVNGWASVLAAVLATLLAVHFGFRAVVLAACALYLAAAVAAPRRQVLGR
ncbi:MAG: SAM-dependent methyltransferase [Thermoanaerobaculia bacterium]